jgi:hypothetical protein
MAQSSAYIPARDADFNNWFENFKTLIAADPTVYGLVALDATTITASWMLWSAAYALASNPTTRTAPNIGQKDAQRQASESVVRPYAQQIARSSGVDPALILGLGLNLPNNSRQPIPAPTSSPAFALVSATLLVHVLSYKDTTLGSTKAKPFGSIGVEVWRSVGTVAAVDPAQCSYYQTWTKSPNRSEFTAQDRGKLATYFARFVTKGGPGGTAQTGPWSEPLAVTVM